MRRYVNIALRQIKDRVNDAFAVPVTEPTIGPDISGVVVADQLGHLLAPVGGTGGSPPSDRNRTDSGGRRIVPKLTVLRQWLQSDGDLRMLNIEFTVAAADGTAMTVVEATAGAATADGSSLEKDPPEDAPTPRVTGFRRGGRIVPGDTLHVSADDPDPWCVAVEQPAGVAAVVDLRTAVDGSAS